MSTQSLVDRFGFRAVARAASKAWIVEQFLAALDGRTFDGMEVLKRIANKTGMEQTSLKTYLLTLHAEKCSPKQPIEMFLHVYRHSLRPTVRHAYFYAEYALSKSSGALLPPFDGRNTRRWIREHDPDPALTKRMRSGACPEWNNPPVIDRAT